VGAITELAVPLHEPLMTEQPWAMGADTGWLEAGDERVLHPDRPPAEPLDAAFGLGQPVRAVLLELLVGTKEQRASCRVRRHDQPMVQRHRADPDGAKRQGEQRRHIHLTSSSADGRRGMAQRSRYFVPDVGALANAVRGAQSLTR
jgi:hypothetical protein